MSSHILYRSLFIVGLALCVTAAGCQSAGAAKGDPATAESASADGAEPAAANTTAANTTAANTTAAKPAEKGGAKKFTLTTKAPDALKSGASADALVSVTPGKGWKWNKDYPASLSFPGAPTQVTLKKTSYKQLAGDFNATEKKADIKVGLTGKTAGKETLKGELKFSVCDATTCIIEKTDVAINLEVAP